MLLVNCKSESANKICVPRIEEELLQKKAEKTTPTKQKHVWKLRVHNNNNNNGVSRQ